MGIKDFDASGIDVAGIKAGEKNATDIQAGSLADGKWFIRILGVNKSQGVSGSGKNVERCLIAYASSENSEPSVAVIAQKVVARWNPEFASKKGIDNAIDNENVYKIELETARDEITVGEYKFKPQNCLSCKKQ